MTRFAHQFAKESLGQPPHQSARAGHIFSVQPLQTYMLIQHLNLVATTASWRILDSRCRRLRGQMAKTNNTSVTTIAQITFMYDSLQSMTFCVISKTNNVMKGATADDQRVLNASRDHCHVPMIKIAPPWPINSVCNNK